MSFGATTYSHWAGSGRRDWLIDVSTTCNITNGPISNIVDGVKANNNADGVFCNSAESGREFKFAWPWPVRIDEFTWTQDSAGTQGTWKFAGSNDDVTYTDLATGINLGGAAAADVHSFTNTNGYRYYKLIQTGGTTTNSRWIQEIEFKVSLDSEYGTGTPGTTSYSNIDGTGNRASRMLMLLDVATACGGSDVGNMNAMLNGVTGAQNCTDAAALPNSGSGHYITIYFRDPLCINEFTWKQSIASNHGTWKIQGSTDNVTFTDIATGLTWGTTTADAVSFSNSNGYNFYRLVQTSGTLNFNPWNYEIEFKTATLVAAGHYFAASAAMEVLTSGDGSSANVATAAMEVLNSGDGVSNAVVATSALEVLSAVAPPAEHYFAASAALEVLSTGDGSSALAAGVALEVLNAGDGTSSAVVPTVAIEVLSTRALAPSRAFDGTKIFEFQFGFLPETKYTEADWDSIYSLGDRIGNGTLIFKQGGWPSTNGNVQQLGDYNWGLSGGNGFSVGSQDGWPGGAYIGWSTADGSFQYLSGIKFFSIFDWPGDWIQFGGYDGVVWGLNSMEFDEFNLGNSLSTTGQATIQFTPSFLPWNYWSVTLASIPESSDLDWPGNAGSSELMFKIYHSILDGGDRRPTNGRPAKRVTVSVSSGIEPNDDTGFNALEGLVDGRYSGSNGGPVPPTGKNNPSRLRRVGWTSGDEAILNPGEYIQFAFPRKVFMREMVWNVGTPESNTFVDGVEKPTVYGTWQWQGSNSPTSGFVDIGEPWSFRPGSTWMKAPAPMGSGSTIPPVEVVAPGTAWTSLRYTGDYHDYMYPYFRMVLVEGPAFGGISIFQVQFNLIDPDNAEPINDAALSDGDSDVLSATPTITAADPTRVTLTDGDDDILMAIPTVVNNFDMTAAFSDGDSDNLTGRSSLFASSVVQTIAIVKGR